MTTSELIDYLEKIKKMNVQDVHMQVLVIENKYNEKISLKYN